MASSISTCPVSIKYFSNDFYIIHLRFYLEKHDKCTQQFQKVLSWSSSMGVENVSLCNHQQSFRNHNYSKRTILPAHQWKIDKTSNKHIGLKQKILIELLLSNRSKCCLIILAWEVTNVSTFWNINNVHMLPLKVITQKSSND